MDDIERAQDYQAVFTADALREHWRKQPVGIGLSHCEECEAEIPAARRRLMPTATHCVACQTEIEFRARRPQ